MVSQLIADGYMGALALIPTSTPNAYELTYVKKEVLPAMTIIFEMSQNATKLDTHTILE